MPWAAKILCVSLCKARCDDCEKFLFRFRIDENNTAELGVEQSCINYESCKHNVFPESA